MCCTMPHCHICGIQKNQIIGIPIILLYHKCVIVYHICGFPRNPYTRCPRKMFICFWDTLYCLHKKVFTRYVHKIDFQTIYLTLNWTNILCVQLKLNSDNPMTNSDLIMTTTYLSKVSVWTAILFSAVSMTISSRTFADCGLGMHNNCLIKFMFE